jgi:hypothetical protein
MSFEYLRESVLLQPYATHTANYKKSTVLEIHTPFHSKKALDEKSVLRCSVSGMGDSRVIQVKFPRHVRSYNQLCFEAYQIRNMSLDDVCVACWSLQMLIHNMYKSEPVSSAKCKAANA